MTKEELTLLEQYLKVKRKDNLYSSEEILNSILTFLLNGKEFTNSSLKISDKTVKTELLQLSVVANNSTGTLCDISGFYYVKDGDNYENRCFDGTYKYELNKATIYLEITRFTKNGGEISDYIEIFHINPTNNTAKRFTSYSNMKPESIIINIDDEIAERYKEETLKLIKR